jgi:hypothetical protein
MLTMRGMAIAILLFSACGDDSAQPPDAAPTPDAPMIDAAPPDAAIDAQRFLSTGDNQLIESETHVASDGNGNVVAAWIGISIGNSTNGYAISHDRGASWSHATHLDAPGGRESSDPVVAADSTGAFFMSWVAFNRDAQQNPIDMHVYVSRLAHGGTTFGTPVEVSNPTNTTIQDKPWVTTDNADNVLVTWGDLGNFPDFAGAQGLQFARSTDHGATFSRTTIIAPTDGKFRNLAFPCVDRTAAGAPYYVVTTSGMARAPQEDIELHRSADSGATWAKTTTDPAADAVFMDPTCAVHGTDVWIAYASGNSAFNTSSSPQADSVKLVHAHDAAGTVTFDATSTVASGPTGTLYLNPQLARTAGGTLEVAFYSGIPNMPATLEHASSTNGTTWTRTPLPVMPGVFTLDRTMRTWLGDYIGGFAADGYLYVSYADNSTACMNAPQLKCVHIAFTRTSSP